ncbi:hypothetical protein NEUTE2DRAFT_62089 [Neurospora tetrasperma FGSC 2509]|nr:hypothetical protein NEUTE2DRAFT_62089 [Neurospora tetrasperma FGSC 2509]
MPISPTISPIKLVIGPRLTQYYFAGWTKPSDCSGNPASSPTPNYCTQVVVNNRLPPLVTANTNPPFLDMANNPPFCGRVRNKFPLSRGPMRKPSNSKNNKAKATVKPRDSESDDELLTPRRSKKVVENIVKRVTALRFQCNLILLRPPIIAVAVVKAL